MGALAKGAGWGALLVMLGIVRRKRVKRTRSHAAERDERLYRAYAEAAEDPDFMRDMEEVERAFEPAVGDGLVATR